LIGPTQVSQSPTISSLLPLPLPLPHFHPSIRLSTCRSRTQKHTLRQHPVHTATHTCHHPCFSHCQCIHGTLSNLLLLFFLSLSLHLSPSFSHTHSITHTFSLSPTRTNTQTRIHPSILSATPLFSLTSQVVGTTTLKSQ